jgi:hypothetical protein
VVVNRINELIPFQPVVNFNASHAPVFEFANSRERVSEPVVVFAAHL